MKKKKVLLSIFFIIIVLGVAMAMGCNSGKGHKEEATKVKNIAVSFEPITNHYLYDQLSEKEKEIYADIVKKLDNYQGGEILLKEPVSPMNVARVADTIRYDGDRKYWYFVMLYCFNDENLSILTGLEQPEEVLNEKSISKFLIEIDLGENQKKLQNFMFEYDDENITKLTNYEEWRTLLEKTKPEEGYYEKVNQQIAKLEQQVIDGMPKDISQEEAVQHVSDWMLKNMNYDTEMLEVSDSMENNTLQDLTDAMESASKACVVNKKGICSGLSAFMADIYNKVGIDANLVFGTAGFNEQKVAHAWIQVHIGGDTFYKDPTYENMYKSKKDLWTKGQLKERKYTFSKHFKWE